MAVRDPQPRGSLRSLDRGDPDGDDPVPTGRDRPAPTDPTGGVDPTLDRLERVFLLRLDHLFNFLRGWLRDDHLAEDVTQQVFLRACQARGRFRGDDDALVGWLFRIARNEAITLARRRDRETSWEGLGEGAPQPVDPDDPPDVAALRAEQRREVAALLDGLTPDQRELLHLRFASHLVRDDLTGLEPDQRELLHLRFAAGLTLVQIAGTLGISDVAARQRLRRTLALLKGAIDDPTTLR